MSSCNPLLIWLPLIVVVVSAHKDSPNSIIPVVDLKSDANDVTVDTEDDQPIDEDIEPFVPSSQWKPILKGQVIPKGLHVRINLETGLREAKILDTETTDTDVNTQYTDTYKKLVVNHQTEHSKVNTIKDDMKHVLKKMMASDDKHNQWMQKDLRSIDEIKRDLDEMDVKIKTESEVLKALIIRYKEAAIEEKLNLLSDVEYLVHSIDIGKDLIQMNAIDLLLVDLNSTDHRLRAQVAFTIASAMNGNPSVQMHVFSKQGLKEFLLLLSYDVSPEVRKKCLFAICCLVRQFPRAQWSLIQEYGALSIFSQFFKQSDIQSIKLSSKVVTLLHGLLIERQMTLKYATNDNLSLNKVKQYRDIGLDTAIVNNGFCNLVPNLLNSPDNDVKEKTIEAMHSFLDICRQEFQQSLSTLQRISNDFNNLSKNEAKSDLNDNYFTQLHQMTYNLINKLNVKSEL